MDDLPPLHELIAHSHLLTEQQRQQGSLEQVGPLLCLHAQGVRDGEPVALDRFFASGCSARAALLAIRNYGPEEDHLLFLVDATAARLADYERAGFRTTEMQWLMRRNGPPPAIPSLIDPAIQIQRARSAADALLLSAIAGMEPVLNSDLRESPLRHYYCTIRDEPVAYVRSARYDETTLWVSHLYTAPAFRGRGYARTLMARLLTDGAEMGVQQTLLLSTEIAHTLYGRLGFTDLAPVALLSLPPALLRRRKRIR